MQRKRAKFPSPCRSSKNPRRIIKNGGGFVICVLKIDWVMNSCQRAKHLKNNLQIVDLKGMVHQDHTY